MPREETTVRPPAGDLEMERCAPRYCSGTDLTSGRVLATMCGQEGMPRQTYSSSSGTIRPSAEEVLAALVFLGFFGRFPEILTM